jgi:hypothetical protein
LIIKALVSLQEKIKNTRLTILRSYPIARIKHG